MRPPTPSERRLLWLLLGAVFLALNLLGLRAWKLTANAQQEAISGALAEVEENRAWILAAEAIGDEFRELPPPPPMSEREASSSLVSLIRGLAQEHGLTVIEESLAPPPEGASERSASARVKLSGPFTGMVRFLFGLQEPGQWRAVEQLTLKAEATPQNVLAEMEVRQYFTESAPVAAPTE